jgi:L-lactate dehydrogenase
MGHTTHGLALLPNALKELQAGTLKAAGEHEVVNDSGSIAVWDGRSLPGTYLLSTAIDQAIERVGKHGVVTYVIRRSGHVGALVAYLRKVTDHGLVAMLMTTNPTMRTVVPAGGIDPVIAPNPIAVGCPTDGEPILIDISTSAVANGWVRRWSAEGKKLPEPWLVDSNGQPTDDPKALFGPPAGAMLPLGGLTLGHKGFALGLIVEIMTGCLTGVGHSGDPKDAGNLVYFQILDPNAFAGRDQVAADAGLLAKLCRASRPQPGGRGVRMPGESATARRREQMASGIALYPTVLPELLKWSQTLGVEAPAPVA